MTLEQTLGDESQVNQETNAVLTQKEGVQQEVVTNLTILPLQIQKADSIKSAWSSIEPKIESKASLESTEQNNKKQKKAHHILR